MVSGVALRPITPNDREFLYRVYASTREDELAPLDWTVEQKSAFLRQQFDAQHSFYMERFPRAQFDVILLNGEPVGRLYVDRRKEEIRIIDIAILIEYRDKGIGSNLMDEVLREAKTSGLPVRIHVELNNRALRLYDRLGFRKIGDSGVYYLMEWSPQSLEPMAPAEKPN